MLKSEFILQKQVSKFVFFYFFDFLQQKSAVTVNFQLFYHL